MAADWLIRRHVSPNAISIAGMVAALLAGVAIGMAPEHRPLWLLGALLVQLRLFANLLDGMVAIGRGIASRLGEVFNEVPDRVADTAVLAGLGIAAGQAWLGLAAALAAMATAYVRAVGRSFGLGSDFCGPGAKQHRMAIVTVAALWCCLAPGALVGAGAARGAMADPCPYDFHCGPAAATAVPGAPGVMFASWSQMFASPVTSLLVISAAVVVGVGTLLIAVLSLTGTAGPTLRRELWLRLGSWLVLLPLMILPVLAGRGWTVAAVTVLGIFCLREYSRATGLFRQPAVQATAQLGLLAENFAALDHWYGFFVAIPSLTIGLIAVVSIPSDRPAGYIQRTGLAVFGFMLFGYGLAHLGYMANDPNYRPIVLTLLLTVALNDVLAFTVGKLLGGAKLLPHTSPGKTRSGAVGALVLITPLVAWLMHGALHGTAFDRLWLLFCVGALVSIAAQAGDLMLSSIKRDLGIKDMGVAIPGHGGILDRYNSLLLVAPATFHLIGYYVGFGLDQPTRLITG